MKRILSFIILCVVSNFKFIFSIWQGLLTRSSHDPYFSIWSFSDNLNESTTRHWTEGPFIDRAALLWMEPYRFPGEPAKELKSAGTDADFNRTNALYETKPGDNWLNAEYDDSGWMVWRRHCLQAKRCQAKPLGTAGKSGCAVYLICNPVNERTVSAKVWW